VSEQPGEFEPFHLDSDEIYAVFVDAYLIHDALVTLRGGLSLSNALVLPSWLVSNVAGEHRPTMWNAVIVPDRPAVPVELLIFFASLHFCVIFLSRNVVDTGDASVRTVKYDTTRKNIFLQ
jgi:hypothetical protein